MALWPGLVRAWHDQGVAADHVPGGRGPLIAAHDVVAPVDIAHGLEVDVEDWSRRRVAFVAWVPAASDKVITPRGPG